MIKLRKLVVFGEIEPVAHDDEGQLLLLRRPKPWDGRILEQGGRNVSLTMTNTCYVKKTITAQLCLRRSSG